MKALHNLLQYRGFILGSVKRDFQARYVGSMLGPVWLVAQPALMVFIYTIVFAKIMNARLPGADGPFVYSLYLCSGLLPWMWFTDVLGRCQNVFLDNANLIKKSNFPRICLPLISALTATVNFALMFAIFLALAAALGVLPGSVLLVLVPLFFVQAVLAVGLGVLLGVVTVFVRDAGPVMAMVLQVWFWLTPIVYPEDALPPWVRDLLAFNPMTHLVRAYHGVFVTGDFSLSESGLPVVAVAAVAVFALAFFSYRRVAGDLVDEL